MWQRLGLATLSQVEALRKDVDTLSDLQKDLKKDLRTPAAGSMGSTNASRASRPYRKFVRL